VEVKRCSIEQRAALPKVEYTTGRWACSHRRRPTAVGDEEVTDDDDDEMMMMR
jgi:hypothetical protein